MIARVLTDGLAHRAAPKWRWLYVIALLWLIPVALAHRQAVSPSVLRAGELGMLCLICGLVFVWIRANGATAARAAAVGSRENMEVEETCERKSDRH